MKAKLVMTGYCVGIRRRVARKAHTACGGYCPAIQPGDVYLECVEFPGGDAGYATYAGHPVRIAVCAKCGDRHPEVLGEVPFAQLARIGAL